MGLHHHARQVANDGKARTVTASRRARGVGETVARKTASTGSEAGDEALETIRETVAVVSSRVNEATDGRAETIPTPSTVAATADRATTLTVEIRQFLDEIDHRYAAKSAVNGARHGYFAGPYGAVLGAGAGTVYGAYTSTQPTFDPQTSNPSNKNENVDIGRYLNGVRRVKTGYEVGKRFGTKGKVAGAAIGAGVSVLPLGRGLAEQVDGPLSRCVDSIPVPTSEKIP